MPHFADHATAYRSTDECDSPIRSDADEGFKILVRQDYESEESASDMSSSELGDLEGGSSTKRMFVLWACTIVGFVMNVLVSVVAPFFPTEAKRLTGTSNGMIGLIFAVFPLTNLVVCPVINFAIRTVGRKATLMLGLLTLASSTVAFGLSETIPLWIFTRILQGAGSAAAGAAYYAILSDMYEENLGFVIGIQEAVTGLGYMVGPLVGAGLYSLGGFRLPFLTLGACPFVICLLLPALLRDARNFEHEYDPNPQLPSCESSPQSIYSSPRTVTDKLLSPPRRPHALEPAWRRVMTLPFAYVALGTTLATCGFAFVEPVLSEHLMGVLGVSTSVAGTLMGVPSVTYIIAAPLGGWLGEKVGYRPVMFAGFLGFALGLFLIGPAPIIPTEVALALRWPIQVVALAMLGAGSAFGTITTLPDMQRTAGPGTTDLTASLFNNVFVPSGEVLGPLLGGTLTQVLGLPRAAVCLGWALAAYAAGLVALHVTGHLSWAHHRKGGMVRGASDRSLARDEMKDALSEDKRLAAGGYARMRSPESVYVSFKDDIRTVPSRLQ